MTVPRPVVARALTSALSLLLYAPVAAGQEDPSPDQTQREFQSLCERATRTDPFFGLTQLDALEQELKVASTPPWRMNVLTRLGVEKLTRGRHTAALENLAQAEEIVATHDGAVPDDLLFTLEFYTGLNHLLLAEEDNCVGLHTGASCILPIQPEALYQSQEHVAAARERFARALELSPTDHVTRWLLNFTAMLTGDFPSAVDPKYRPTRELADSSASAASFVRWSNVAPTAGLAGVDHAGGGVIDDFDGDGRLDLVSSSWDLCTPLTSYRNLGNGRFEDVSKAWGLVGQSGGLNLTHADFDGDGDLDLLVLRGGWRGDQGRIRNSLLENRLNEEVGRFVDITHRALIAHPAYPTQTAAWADYDLDGDLDLYVGNESSEANTNVLALTGTGRAYPSQLFENLGQGTFRDVARRAGVANDAFAKGVSWGDYDQDGDADLYVSNIGPNRLYRNAGDGRFEDVALVLGVDGGNRRTFGAWWFDYDNDGDLDLWVSDYAGDVPDVARWLLDGEPSPHHPRIYRNEGSSFRDVSADLGLNQPILPMGASFGDLDADGWLDIYLGTGTPSPDAIMPNVTLRNRNGFAFDDVTFSSGLGHTQKGHGVAFGDLDGDGDEDLFEQIGGAFPFDGFPNSLYLNPSTDHGYLTLELDAGGANRFAVGAKVEVRLQRDDATRSVYRWVTSGGSFGGSSYALELTWPRGERAVELRVWWPGSTSPQSAELDTDGAHLRWVKGQPEPSAAK